MEIKPQLPAQGCVCAGSGKGKVLGHQRRGSAAAGCSRECKQPCRECIQPCRECTQPCREGMQSCRECIQTCRGVHRDMQGMQTTMQVMHRAMQRMQTAIQGVHRAMQGVHTAIQRSCRLQSPPHFTSLDPNIAIPPGSQQCQDASWAADGPEVGHEPFRHSVSVF